MAKQIVVTVLAENSFNNVVAYLSVKWSEKTANDFIKRFEQVYELLDSSPGIYPFVNKSTRLQKCVLTKHNILYFRVENDNVITILDVFDTRQNPEKLRDRF